MGGTYDGNTYLYYISVGFWIEADYVNISGFYLEEQYGLDVSGIHLNESHYCNISGNVIENDSSDGICIENSSYNTIYNNWIGENQFGIILINSSWNAVEENYIVGNGDCGILYLPSEQWLCNNTISNNNISENFAGIVMIYTDNETITDNDFYYNAYCGIYFECVNDSLVADNDFIGNGFIGEGPDGPPSGIVLKDCYNVTASHNILYGGEVGGWSAGIFIMGEEIPVCNNTIIDNTVWGYFFGIYLYGADNETVEGNTIFDNFLGILLEYSWNNTISDNNVTNNEYGVYLADYSTHNALSDNDITDNGCGIYLGSSPSNSITDNYIAENYGDTGIYIDSGSNHTNITNNVIKENDVGIYVYGGYEGAYENVDTQIHWNKIYGNYEYGVVYYIVELGTPWINATYNWWGSANGPSSNNDNMLDPITGNPANGTGDEINGSAVYDNIHFDPWLGLMLYKGWNMITPAFINDSIETAEDLGALISGCTVVTVWDNVHQKYVSHVVGFAYDFALVNGTGYLVFVREDVNLQFNGTLLEPEINLTLRTGYNMIGWPYAMYTTASQIAENITNCIKVAKWNAQEQEWLPEYITALPGYDFDILMGEGVFVFISSGTTQWQVTPTPPPPP
ncbi:MAG: right-handed parallel beta-helix repeat-containing protein [Candidatus Thermoplasmatota archaeon]|nr:right-handed parallel beta-helix repeat-containing protein [Candidatus Thermoplasmatota archaeon]